MRVYFLFSVAVFIERPRLAAWFSSSLSEVKGKKEAILQQVYLAPRLDDSMENALFHSFSVLHWNAEKNANSTLLESDSGATTWR